MTTETTRQTLPRRSESGMNTRAINAAAGVLLAAMEQGRQTPTGLAIALDAARLLNSPEHAAELERLRTASLESLLATQIERDEARSHVADLEARLAEYERPADEDPITYALTDKADAITRRLAPVQALREDQAAEQPLTVFRASHDSIVMGLYTTAAAARAHCEAEERRAWPMLTSLAFDWIEDEEDGVAELVIDHGDEETETGYVVTALEVAAAYDAGADE